MVVETNLRLNSYHELANLMSMRLDFQAHTMSSSSVRLVIMATLKRLIKALSTTIRATVSQQLPLSSGEELISRVLGGANVCMLWVWF